MNQTTATVTSQWRITIPTAIRRHLGLKRGDRLAFVISDDGRVVLQVARYPTVASLAGGAGRLPRPLTTDEVLEFAREDALVGEHEPTRNAG